MDGHFCEADFNAYGPSAHSGDAVRGFLFGSLAMVNHTIFMAGRGLL